MDKIWQNFTRYGDMLVWVAVILVLLIAVVPAAEAPIIGRALSAASAQVERDGAKEILAAKSLVRLGDKITTGPGGSLAIVFSDGTTFNIAGDSSMVLDQFVYAPKGGDNAMSFSLLTGTFTFISGAVARTGDMKMTTPVGTMGIRGTAPHVEIDPDGTVRFSTLIEDNKKALLAGAGAPADVPLPRPRPFDLGRPLPNLNICRGC